MKRLLNVPRRAHVRNKAPARRHNPWTHEDSVYVYGGEFPIDVMYPGRDADVCLGHCSDSLEQAVLSDYNDCVFRCRKRAWICGGVIPGLVSNIPTVVHIFFVASDARI